MSKRNWVIGVIATLAFLLMFYSCALPGDLPASRDSGEGLAGTYTVNGTDAQGVEYSGTVVIVNTEAVDTYIMEWIITGSILQGTAIRTGAELVAEWETTSAGANGAGRTVYVIQADGRLDGTRQTEGFVGTGTEELFPEP